MQQQINFVPYLPMEVENQLTLSWRQMTRIYAVFITFCFIFSSYGIWQVHRRGIEILHLNNMLNIQEQRMQALIAEYPGLDANNLTVNSDQKSRVVKQLEAYLSVGNKPGDVLTALSKAVVDGLWLKEITLTEGNSKLELLGQAIRADVVQVFIAQLTKQPIFSGISFQAAEVTQSTGKTNEGKVISFKIISGPAK
ncbi:MAG: PilN domain-containing protein [Gammaproteobacteria bacterium]|nr:PilN domain-containing protein [Gammaproteobacteria bacterium]